MSTSTAVAEHLFVSHRQRDWDGLDALVRRATQQGMKALAPDEVGRISPLYRDVCADLARAQAAHYGAPLLDYLHGLTASAHTLLYAAQTRAHEGGAQARARTWIEAFPRVFRAHGKAMALGFALFFLPFFAGLAATLAHPDFAFRVAPESMLRPLTEAYAKGFADGRGAGEGTLMAGFYVDNNVGIALRCFALGIFGGVGSAFYLVQNGLATGAILGYVASQGAGANILTFVLGHSSFELGAIAIAGGAGLMLGWSVVAPGDKTRRASLEAAGRDAVVLVSGAAVMLFMAAAIEAFWSASSMPSAVKRGIGIFLFVVVALYLGFVGRGSPSRSREPS
ncbi:MAG TPA: stage II sporulation protein M [Polyangiaceae bacterium]